WPFWYPGHARQARGRRSARCEGSGGHARRDGRRRAGGAARREREGRAGTFLNLRHSFKNASPPHSSTASALPSEGRASTASSSSGGPSSNPPVSIVFRLVVFRLRINRLHTQ